MALAVCLLFDPGSDRLVRELWARLEDAGVRTLATHTHRHHHPHLSYAVLRTWDLERVQEAMEELPGSDRFTVPVHGTLAFPRGRAALAPALAPDLGLRQARVVAALEATGADLHRHYRPGQWVPHVSLATRARSGQLATVARTVSDALPLTFMVDRAALVDSTTGRTWPLPHVL